jgi:transcriptional regulator with XRE-family HTH domain
MSKSKHSQMEYTESMNKFLLQQLDKLLKEKGLNKAQFSRKSGIPYTTIDGFYKKGMDNIRFSTLRKIVDFFNISIAYFVEEEEMLVPLIIEDIIPQLRDDIDLQNFMVRFVTELTKEQQKSVMNMVEHFAYSTPHDENKGDK